MLPKGRKNIITNKELARKVESRTGMEADEVARLNTTIEAQAAEIRELKEEIKRLGFNETIHPAPQSPDEHPEEKKSWWQRVNDWNDR